MSRIKVCFIIPTFSAGGIETYLLRFLQYYDSIFDVTVIARLRGSDELYEAFKKTNAKLVFKSIGYLNPLKAHRYFVFFKKNKFDVVCDFNANFSGVVLLMARLAGIQKRLAFYRQGSDHFKPNLIKNSVNIILNRLVYLNATKILFNSVAALDVFFPYRQKEEEQFNVIYNGVDPSSIRYSGTRKEARQKLGLPIDQFIVGHVGRNDPIKNHKTIFKTASELAGKRNDVHFVLCGKDTELFKEEMERYGLTGQMTILGYRDDVPLVLKALDLFFFPSMSEGQPNALIEAMLAGLPLMASDIKPIRECLPTEYNKYLADPRDWEKFSRHAELFMNASNAPSLVSWAEEKFDSKKNFEQFKKQLTD